MNYVKIGSAHLFTMTFSELELIDIDVCQEPKETLEHYYLRQEAKPDLLLNCGFFTQSSGDPVFSLMDEGDLKSVNLNDRTGLALIGANKMISGSLVNLQGNKSVRDFVTAYPMLISDKEIVKTSIASEIAYATRRTIVGWDDNHVEVILIDNPGMTLDEARTFIDSRPLNFAGNLDGGGSTRGLYKGERVTEDLWGRPIDNVMAFYLKKSIVYRVQVGSFIIEEYAKRLRDNIVKLPDPIGIGYSKAYVSRPGDSYKVQVGAFQIRSNALRVVDDLASKGIKAFIVTSY